MKFIDYNWKPYNLIGRDNRTKRDQISKLYYTGLIEDGKEYTFIPTKTMEYYHSEILKLYNKIKVVDNEIELCNEVYFTSKIEGANTTLKRTIEMHNGTKICNLGSYSECMILGGFRATKLMNLYGNKINEDIVIRMWNILVENCCENQSVRGDKYRIGTVQAGNNTVLWYECIQDAMNNWYDFVNSDSLNDYPFIKAALIHCVYERIHPFCDGNGRSGRLLMLNYLIGQGFYKCKAIGFTRKISETLDYYYLGLNSVQNSYNDCTNFIEYMLQVFYSTFQDVLTNVSMRTDERKVRYNKYNQPYIKYNGSEYLLNINFIQFNNEGKEYIIIDNTKIFLK